MADTQKLSDEVKTFIVEALACFDTPKIVSAAVKAEFEIVVARQAVEAYDPTKRQGKALSDKLKAHFEKTRKAFLEQTDAIPIAHKAVRLRTLDRMARLSEERGNYVLAGQLNEQAAKEVGDAYTNTRNLKHDVSDPLLELLKAVSGTGFRPTGDAGKP